MPEKLSQFARVMRLAKVDYENSINWGDKPLVPKFPQDIDLGVDQQDDPQNSNLLKAALIAFQIDPELSANLDRIDSGATATRSKGGQRWLKFGLVTGAAVVGAAVAAAIIIHDRKSQRDQRDKLIHDYLG